MLDRGFRRLSRKNHERPAAMVRTHLHGHAGLRRLAKLAQERQIGSWRAFGTGVDHQPVLDKAEILVRDIEGLTDNAVTAVGTDEPTPFDLALRPALIVHRHHHAL